MSKTYKFVLAFLIMVGTSAFAFADLTPVELLNTGRADEALRTLQHTNVNSAEHYNLLCRVYFSLQDYDNAIANGERAVQMAPNVSSYYLWLGRSYGEKADQVNAISAYGLARKTVAAFEKAVQLDPNDAHARRDLAEYYIEAPAIVGGGRDKARKLADDIVGKDAVTAAYIRAWIASKEKNYGEAERQYKYALQVSGNSAATWFELARLYRDTQRWSDFDNAVAQAIASPKKSSSDMYDIGEIMIKVNRNLPQAIGALRQYLSGATDEYGPAFRAHYLIGNAFLQQGNQTEAKNEYRTALSLASGFRPAQDALHKLGG